MEDELVIKRKLLFDGEGLGDERRLNLLQKMIAKWILCNEPEEDNLNVFNRICFQLSAVEHSRRKSELLKKTNRKDLDRYESYKNDLERNISDINKTIEASRSLLSEVKKFKQQKLNYDLIAREISSEPSRAETSKNLEDVRVNLLEMKNIETKVNAEWSVLRKHCSLIVTTANQLNSVIEDSKYE
ncbi:unnamed protein product [Phyllotreta striolata]|uniref:THO complex subunit 7 n=1 Tax=Phyllotreta striolata TaxID=444603 RepID=A0A9N9XM58_PHYSR|nr:unnamed protein product [Phyllotreta striolata]